MTGGRGKRSGTKTDEKVAKGASTTVLNTVEMVAVMRYGMTAKMTPPERNMMADGLTICFTRLPLSVTQQVSDISAPMLAAFGLVMYITRLASMERQRAEQHASDERAGAVNAAQNITRDARQSATATNAPQTTPTPPTNPADPRIAQVPPKDFLMGLQEGMGPNGI